MLKKENKVIFTITNDKEGNGFTLSTKIKGRITMDHFKAISGYTAQKYNQYTNKIKKETSKNRVERRK